VTCFVEPIGASKHHVLEHVRESLAIGLLVLRPDVIPNLNRDDGAGKIFERNDLQAVIQDDLLVGKGRLGGIVILGSVGPEQAPATQHKQDENGRQKCASHRVNSGDEPWAYEPTDCRNIDFNASIVTQEQ
jgi:hypothetical protein